ncbi:MAG: hypothetical protein H7267_04975 [Sandarakinorhabdus sp.]|nr:hypothetical protein [Sandarakinorhabdus sp.]
MLVAGTRRLLVVTGGGGPSKAVEIAGMAMIACRPGITEAMIFVKTHFWQDAPKSPEKNRKTAPGPVRNPAPLTRRFLESAII